MQGIPYPVLIKNIHVLHFNNFTQSTMCISFLFPFFFGITSSSRDVSLFHFVILAINPKEPMDNFISYPIYSSNHLKR